MWEAIRANTRRSWVLIGFMGALLVGLGAVIGAFYVPDHGAAGGAVIALTVWFVMLLVAFAGGKGVLLASAKARRIKKEDAPRLWNIVEEMTIASGLGNMPEVYVIDDDVPNAFAVGHKQEAAAVAVTSGLLRRLNRDELQGVVAHEIGHIKNLDVKFMTIAGVMLGAIVIIADIFLRSLWFGGGRRSSRDGGGGAQAIIVLVAVALAILAPLLAQVLYFACSRQREYLADASAARYTRYPAGLASALEKISGQIPKKAKASRALAPMYIVNPLQSRSASGPFSTHPPIDKRVRILRSMGGMAGFADYEAAYRKIEGTTGQLLGDSVLREKEQVTARRESAEVDKRAEAVERAREVTDMLDRMVHMLLIPCACGVRIKVPEGYARGRVACPRCGVKHEIPQAKGAKEAAPEQKEKLIYHRKGEQWESFRCPCGKNIQLSPAFNSDSVTCHGCHRRIDIA